MTPAPVFDSPLYPKPHPVGEPKRTPARPGLPASLDRILWVARRTPARPGLPSGLRQRDTRGWVGSCQGTRYLSRPGRQVSVGYEFRRIWLPGGGCGGKFRRFRVRGVGIAPGVPVFSWFSHALCQGIPVLINGHALPWLFRHAQNHRENCTEGGESGIIKTVQTWLRLPLCVVAEVQSKPRHSVSLPAVRPARKFIYKESHKSGSTYSFEANW